ncbi:MAG TPA: hypothetical protein VHE34_28045 [Puia sp.]|uniref:hypothetical protein n=1 Tax=Puia sp. TaxID=2045100 RepID=UPI002CA38314|nr:hypothetical protein [Puia sp.]HVU99119.1 hypothetical protein [Puia sp.]
MIDKGIKIIGKLYILGPLVFLLLLWLIYRQVTHQPGWQDSLGQIKAAVTGPQQWKLWLVLLLMPLNWGIEARKWQLALRPIGGIPYRNAFMAVFTGTTMACFTPNRMGEYLGRILYIKEGQRIRAISLTMACSIAQLMVTLFIGLLGICYLYATTRSAPAGLRHWQLALTILGYTVATLLILLTFIYCRLSLVASVLLKIPGIGKYSAFIKVLENFDAAILLRILFLSFGRYIVFIIQYSLVFPVFGVALGFWQAWNGMSVVFLVMAIIPTLTFLTELGLRWEASIQVLELYSSNVVGIFAASFAIWLINLIIPALIGSLLIVRIKLFKSR